MSDDKRLDESDPDVQQMRVNEIAKDFFVAEIPARPEKKRRKSRAPDKDVKALAEFVKALQQMEESSRLANILWLVDRFLGVRL